MSWEDLSFGCDDRVSLATQIAGRNLLVEVIETSEGVIVDVYDDARVGGECIGTIAVCVNDLDPLPDDPR